MNSKSHVTRMGLVLAVSLIMLCASLSSAFAWTLTGTIKVGSNPLADTRVTAYNSADQSVVGSSTTDIGGVYTITVNNGTYNLLIAPPVASGLANSVVNGVAVSGANVTQNVLLVTPSVTVSGVLRLPDGNTVNGVQVTILDQASGSTVGQMTTGVDGIYSFPVAPGTYKFSLFTGYNLTIPGGPNHFVLNPAAINVSVTNTAYDITLPFVTLSGITTNGQDPVAGVTVWEDIKTWRDSSVAASTYYETSYTSGAIKSGAAGEYRILLFPGSHTITALPPAGSALAQTVYSNLSITADTVKNLLLNPAVTVSGMLQLPDRSPVKGVQVSIIDQANGGTVGQMTTGDDGRYSFPVSPGIYKFSLFTGYNLTIPGGPNHFILNPAAINLSVTGDTTYDITLPFVTLNGITTNGQDPVANVTVWEDIKVWRDSSIAASTYYETSYTSGAIKSNAFGEYKILLFPNTHNITALPPAGSSLAQMVYSNLSITADTVRDLVLNPAVTVSGLLRLPDGTAVKDVQVTMIDQVSGGTVGQMTTGIDGRYSFKVSAGVYKFSLSTGYSVAIPGGPNHFMLNPVAVNVSVSSDTEYNITLPFVTLSGRTTDANGVPIAGITVWENIKTWRDSSVVASTYYETSYTSGAIKSDASGNYKMLLFPSVHSISVLPPAGSGFAQTPINNLNITQNILQNIILNLPDSAAPIILSGPIVSSRTDTTATIEWQTNEPAKGSVLYGTSSPPTTVVAESAFITYHSMPLTGLTADTTYYIKVTATDATGNGTSENQLQMISFSTNQTETPKTPVILTGPMLTIITHNSAVVEWTTKEPSTGTVFYGLANVPNQSISDTTLATSHRVTLTGLIPLTTYYLNTTVTGAVSAVETSTPVIDFRTVADLPPPAPRIVEGPMAVNTTDTGVSIIWKTDKPATSGVSWNDGTLHGVLADTDQTTSHSIIVTGLAASTLYSYVVSSRDDFGNDPVLSDTKDFTTKPSTAPNPPPVITLQPVVINVNHQMALIYWETDEQADSVIEYGLSSALGTTDAKAELNTRHNRPLTGLQAGMKYYYRVASKDAAGNGPTYSAIGTFTTDDHDKGKAPVVTVAPKIIHKDDDKGVVYWETDEPCDTVVEHGEGSELTDRHSDGEKVNKHQATITNLKANTSYNVRVSCTDTDGHRVEAKAGTPSTFVAFNMGNILSDAMINATGATGFVTQSQPDTTAPVITENPAATFITGTQATITWTTDEIADSQVNYNPTGQALTLTAGDITKVFSHSIVLTNLTPETVYSFTVTSTDPSGNPVSSSTISFSTTVLTRTVSFNSDGGSTVTGLNVVNNSTASEPTAPTKTGYTFAGWYADVALTSPVAFSTAITADTTLYAKWTLNRYAIGFQADGNGTLTGIASQTVNYGASATAVTAEPAIGYHFVNWTGTGGFVTSTTNPLTLSNVTADQTITAHFVINPTNGVCGSSNGGYFTEAPVSNICAAGTASSLGGAGPWSWSCGGIDGGRNMSCSASIGVAPLTALPVAPALQTGQTLCYDATTAPIECANSGQDGEFQNGLQWPTPRFVDNGDQTQTDTLTGLIWSKNANPAAGTKNWQEALDYIKTLNNGNYLGHNDWRLPNINELASLINNGRSSFIGWLYEQGFTFPNVQYDYFWSATTKSANGPWVINLNYGNVGYYYETYGIYVWPVRSGQSGSIGSLSLPKTGQTTCYNTGGATIDCSDTGQDGELQVGVTWPSPRFAANADRSITDNLTGLMWSSNANPAGGIKSWQQALEYINTLNSSSYLGHNDWRLPTSNELATLANKGQVNSATWLNGQGFSSVENGYYWSATTKTIGTSVAWSVYMSVGDVVAITKNSHGYVWPVRSGQFWFFDSLIYSASPKFGTVHTDTQPPARQLTIGNRGSTVQGIASIAITGVNATEFSLTNGGSNPCGSLSPTLAAGASCTLMLGFSPANNVEMSASLDITANGTTNKIPLSGTAISTIYGVVTDQATGLPVPGATVTLNTTGTTTTNSNGNYTFGNLPAANYGFTISKSGYQSVSKSGLAVGATTSVQGDILLPTVGTLNITSTTLPWASPGVPYSNRVMVAGGTAPYTFSKDSRSLPTGLSLNSATGIISGTPTGTGSYTFAIGVTDSTPTAYSEMTFTIDLLPPLQITKASLASGQQGIAYNATITATGGKPALSFAIIGETLPSGMNIDSIGAISGTPRESGT
ncbi:MAG: DUF1566 domain-containing protein [Desulfuromonadaceae bacterium]